MEYAFGVSKKPVIVILLSVLFSVIVLFVCLGIGSSQISYTEIIDILFSQDNSINSKVIYDIRLPRLLLAFAVGGGLSITGAVFQAILLNPLAEPYILGISSGGAFGAVLSFLIGMSFFGTQIFAFLGALIVIMVVFIVGRRFGELDPNILLLSGVMIGAFLSALILIMITLLGDSLRNAVLWLMGNLSDANIDQVVYILPLTLVVAFILSVNSFKYNILSFGNESARSMGINTKLFKNFTYIISSLLVGALVSVSGIIGFVGLLIPHLVRILFGMDNRIVVPVSFFIGAAYLMITDTVARTIILPAELPVGAITALLGAPLFIFLLRRRYNSIG